MRNSKTVRIDKANLIRNKVNLDTIEFIKFFVELNLKAMK